jgi:hypothetical protein
MEVSRIVRAGRYLTAKPRAWPEFAYPRRMKKAALMIIPNREDIALASHQLSIS